MLFQQIFSEEINMKMSLINETELIDKSNHEKDTAIFWVLVSIYFSIALVALLGNALVLYVSFSNRNHGPLKHFDCVIQSLAVADMLYGLIGMPCRTIGTNIVSLGSYKKIVNLN